jgi:hypothetical protein
MTRRQRIHQQRFVAHRNIGLRLCEEHGHVMALVADWSLALADTRQLYTCVRCGQRFNLDISRLGRARIGLALDHTCPRRMK